MRLDDYLQPPNCTHCNARTATRELSLPHYVKVFSCELCWETMRKMYREALEVRLL